MLWYAYWERGMLRDGCLCMNESRFPCVCVWRHFRLCWDSVMYRPPPSAETCWQYSCLNTHSWVHASYVIVLSLLSQYYNITPTWNMVSELRQELRGATELRRNSGEQLGADDAWFRAPNGRRYENRCTSFTHDTNGCLVSWKGCCEDLYQEKWRTRNR